MSYVITAFFGKYLFSDGKMGMMGCPNIYKSSVSLVPKTAYPIDSIGFMFTKCQNRKSFIYNKLRDFRESLVEHEYADNDHTIEGTLGHARVHAEGQTSRGELFQLRSAYLYSKR